MHTRMATQTEVNKIAKYLYTTEYDESKIKYKSVHYDVDRAEANVLHGIIALVYPGGFTEYFKIINGEVNCL